jgi:hypothetical protein
VKLTEVSLDIFIVLMLLFALVFAARSFWAFLGLDKRKKEDTNVYPKLDPTADALNDIVHATALSNVILEDLRTILNRPNAASQNLIARVDELQMFLVKQDAGKVQVLDAIVAELERLNKNQKQFTAAISSMFSGGSITTVDDEEGANMERAQVLMRRYGLTQEQAMDRVKGSNPYQTNNRGGR